jgi:hypothetical protein
MRFLSEETHLAFSLLERRDLMAKSAGFHLAKGSPLLMS